MATPKNARDGQARQAVEQVPYGTPRQIPGMARLMPLTPELYAHYADAPAPVDTPMPEEAN